MKNLLKSISLSSLVILLMTACTTKQIDDSVKPYTISVNNKIKVVNLLDTGVITSIDKTTNSLTILHDNGLVSVFKNMETMSPVLYANKEILKGYILGLANSETTYEQIVFK